MSAVIDIKDEQQRPRTRVRERAEEQSSAMEESQQTAIRMLANDLHRLNQAVMRAVEAGVSVVVDGEIAPNRHAQLPEGAEVVLMQRLKGG